MQQKWQRALFIPNDSEAESGFSLIEVLLSITITILLTHLIIQLCTTLIKQQAFLQGEISLTENIRFAEFILKREIQTAGFCGCNRLSQLDIHYHVSRWYLPIVPIQLFPKDTRIMGKRIYPDSEVIVIEKMIESTPVFLAQEKPKTIKIGLKNLFEPDELLIISDCTQADVFTPSAVQHGSSSQFIAVKKPLNSHYCRAELGKLAVTAFFIQKTSRRNQKGEPIKALYSYDFIHHRKTEWVSNVETMEFFYATWDDNDHELIFEPLSQDTDLSTIRLVKIVLSFGSEQVGINNNKKQEILISLREL